MPTTPTVPDLVAAARDLASRPASAPTYPQGYYFAAAGITTALCAIAVAITTATGALTGAVNQGGPAS